jgi:glycosyltransferase involved in cell wall biosynthesis
MTSGKLIIDNEILLSICVPTYNRVSMLNDLYESIITQNSYDTQLVIVNDGSIDETEIIVDGWIKEKKVKIKYFFQNNSGRGSALRKALLNSDGEYSIIMDDDDYFLEGSFDIIRDSVLKLKCLYNFKKPLAGFSFHCVDEDGHILGNKFQKDEYISDYFKIRFFDNISGDKKEIVKTDIINNNIYNHYYNESRVVTTTLWHKIAYYYDCVCINTPVAVKRYLTDGMTDALLIHKTQSPNYQIDNWLTKINYPHLFSFYNVFLFSMFYWKYWFFGGSVNLFKIKFSRLPLVLFALPMGFVLFLRDIYKVKTIK